MHSRRSEQLVAEHGAHVLGYLVNRVGPEDSADLRGGVHEVLVRREDRIPEDEREARLWYFGVARRVVLAHRRRTSITRQRLRHLAAAIEHAAEDTGPDAAERLAVRHAVRALPVRQRELVVLVHWDGLTLAEAAEHLGMRASTARTHYQRARQRLVAALDTAVDTPSPAAAPRLSAIAARDGAPAPTGDAALQG